MRAGQTREHRRRRNAFKRSRPPRFYPREFASILFLKHDDASAASSCPVSWLSAPGRRCASSKEPWTEGRSRRLDAGVLLQRGISCNRAEAEHPAPAKPCPGAPGAAGSRACGATLACGASRFRRGRRRSVAVAASAAQSSPRSSCRARCTARAVDESAQSAFSARAATCPGARAWLP